MGGRGVVRVGFPDLPPNVSVLVSATMVYHTLEEMRRLIAELQGTTPEDADVLLRMLETYDPSRQAVVTAAIEGQNPIRSK